MKTFTVLVCLALILLILAFVKGATKSEAAVLPHCTNTSLDKYIYPNGCRR